MIPEDRVGRQDDQLAEDRAGLVRHACQELAKLLDKEGVKPPLKLEAWREIDLILTALASGSEP